MRAGFQSSNRWPAEVESLTHRLIEVEIAIAGVSVCDAGRRERLELAARRLAAQLEVLKRSAPARERAA